MYVATIFLGEISPSKGFICYLLKKILVILEITTPYRGAYAGLLLGSAEGFDCGGILVSMILLLTDNTMINNVRKYYVFSFLSLKKSINKKKIKDLGYLLTGPPSLKLSNMIKYLCWPNVVNKPAKG